MLDGQSRHETPTLSILMVTYNNENHIASILEALSESTSHLETELLIWDNASQDGTLGVLSESVHFEACSVTASSQNLGFARAVNALRQSATGDFLLLLNPDCRLNRHSLDSMLTLIKESEAGAVGPILNNQVGKRHAGGGWFPTNLRLISELLYLPDVFPNLARTGIFARRRDATLSANAYAVDWVAGTCLLTPRRLMNEVGGLSEKWFMYCEDMDYGRRLATLNVTCSLASGSQVDHIGGGSLAPKRKTSQLQIQTLASFFQDFGGGKRSISAWIFRFLLLCFDVERRLVGRISNVSLT